MPTSDPLWYCHECDEEFHPIIMFPKPLCASCYSPSIKKMVAPDSVRVSQRVNPRRGSSSRQSPSIVVDPTSDSSGFGSFLKRFAHQPRSPGLSRTSSATTAPDIDVDLIEESFQSEVLSNEGHDGSQTNVGTSDLITLAISRTMPVSSVLDILVQHGCHDVTQDLDQSTCSEYPIANGGFGDIYRGKLTSGVQVAIKCTRIIAGSVANKEQEHLA
ncbi:hypothetical protein FRC12_019786, partial [Ceratobasidium sp. 428]